MSDSFQKLNSFNRQMSRHATKGKGKEIAIRKNKKIDKIIKQTKKQPKQLLGWSKFESRKYAQILLYFVEHQISIQEQFFDYVASAVNRTIKQVQIFHFRMMNEHNSYQQIFCECLQYCKSISQINNRYKKQNYFEKMMYINEKQPDVPESLCFVSTSVDSYDQDQFTLLQIEQMDDIQCMAYKQQTSTEDSFSYQKDNDYSQTQFVSYGYL